MNTSTITLHSTTDSSSPLSALLTRSGIQHGVPMPLGNEGDPDCYPNDESETNP